MVAHAWVCMSMSATEYLNYIPLTGQYMQWIAAGFFCLNSFIIFQPLLLAVNSLEQYWNERSKPFHSAPGWFSAVCCSAGRSELPDASWPAAADTSNIISISHMAAAAAANNNCEHRGLLQLINPCESNINLKHCSGGIYLQHNVEDEDDEEEWATDVLRVQNS